MFFDLGLEIYVHKIEILSESERTTINNKVSGFLSVESSEQPIVTVDAVSLVYVE